MHLFPRLSVRFARQRFHGSVLAAVVLGLSAWTPLGGLVDDVGFLRLEQRAVAGDEETPWVSGPIPALSELPPESRAFLRDMSDRTLKFFLDNYRNGVYLDAAPNGEGEKADLVKGMGSIAATGYGLAILSHAAKFGRVDPELARTRLRETLKAMLDAPHHNGWLVHFLTTDSPPKRFGTSEFSTIDTALLLYGAAYAVTESGDPEAKALFDRLVDRIDWESMRTNGGALPEKMTLSMGWKDGAYERAEWSQYNETPLLVLLGIGLDKLPAEAWWAWRRQYVSTADGKVMAGGESLFMHQFLSLYLGDRPIKDGFPSYFENSKLATLFNRRFTAERADVYRGFWGLSAAPTPEGGYFAYGPRGHDHDGTVCLSAALASAAFFPKEAVASLRDIVAKTGKERLIGTYGFYESYNPGKDWRSDVAIAISLAPIYQAEANLDPKTSFVDDVHRVPFIAKALQRIEASAAAFSAEVPRLYEDVGSPCARTAASL